MKKYKIFNKIGLAICLTLGLVAGSACSPTDDGPSIDDHFLNYEIPQIRPSSDIPVGAIYWNLGSAGVDEKKYARLIGEYNQSGQYPQLCPNVRPVLGRYSMDINKPETADLIQQHLTWSNNAGINFLILPNIGLDTSKGDLLNEGNVNFVNYMAGLNPNSEGIHWDGLRYVVSMDMNNFANGLNNTAMIEDDTDENGVSARCEQLYEFFVSLTSRFCTNNDLYYTVDGKPMIVVWNADKLYARDSEKLYNTIRERVRENVKDGNGNGLEMYILARQERWTPPARWHNFFLSGKVDAVYMDNMYNQTDWFRPTCYPQCIDQNFKYNREYEWDNYGVDFVPTVSPSFNQWIDGDGTQFYNFPPVFKDEDLFRKMCNVAKMNLGKRPMVIIDSFNRWNVDQAIEPTDPNYGNGYGMKYLNIVKEEFKVK